ncbi:MAG: hypothetical protein KDA80_08540 [Planctomycetaceae bacterium]|nr:hypothetical protein [Planctomycetaceae bacterium]MCA9070974.1 hypothetical protein [Planctomycetaceae bacterium]
MKTVMMALCGLATTLCFANVSDAQVRFIRSGGPRVITINPNGFGGRHHLDDLAYEMKLQANDVAWEMYRRYQHNPGFSATYAEMHELLRDANHIHDLVHASAHHHFHDVDHIAADLHEIDQLFHHIEDDIVGWRPSFHSHHHHAAHGDLFTKMERLEDTLHHLMEDYGVHSRITETTAPPAPTTGIAPPPRF